MRPEDRDAASLWDALEAARRISSYVRGMSFDEYMNSSVTRAAVERELTIVGEALNRLSPAAAQAHPEIAIPGIVGLPTDRSLGRLLVIEHEGATALRVAEAV